MQTWLKALMAAATLPLLGNTAVPKPPKDLSITDRSWSTNADGYIFTIGFFTEAEMQSRNWEAKRIKARKFARICDGEKVAFRDVVWGRAADGPMCAKVIYSITCGVRRSDWGSSLRYERDDAVMQDVTPTGGPICGDKFVRSPELTDVEKERRRAAEQFETVSNDARCESGPDLANGKFAIASQTRFWRRTVIDAGLKGSLGKYWQPTEPDFLITYAAGNTQTVHTVFSKTPLTDDGTNVLLTLVFANDETAGSYCVTLTASQGETRWQKTLRRQSLLSPKARKLDTFGHPVDPQSYWDPNTDAHALADELATFMGLDVGKDHRNAMSQRR